MSGNPNALHAYDTDKVDTFEADILGLTEAVTENSRKLDALLEHFEVPYKPPEGFIKE